MGAGCAGSSRDAVCMSVQSLWWNCLWLSHVSLSTWLPAWVTEVTRAYAPDAEMMSSCKCHSSRKNRAGFENRVTLFVVCLSGWYWWCWDQTHVIQALLFWSHTSSSAWLGLSQVCISVTSYVLWPMETITINSWVWDMNWTVHRIRQVSQSSRVDKAKQLYWQK